MIAKAVEALAEKYAGIALTPEMCGPQGEDSPTWWLVEGLALRLEQVEEDMRRGVAEYQRACAKVLSNLDAGPAGEVYQLRQHGEFNSTNMDAMILARYHLIEQLRHAVHVATKVGA